MWTTSPAAVPASPTRSVFPNDKTDASVIEHEKLQRERRRNRWLAVNRVKDVEKCKAVWNSPPCTPTETKVIAFSATDMSGSKTNSSGKLTTSQVAASDQKSTSTRAPKPGEGSKSESKGKSKKSKLKIQERHFPLKEQQWMRVPLQKRSEVSKRTPAKVKLKIKTQISESNEKHKPSNGSEKNSSKNDVFTRLARSNSRRVKSPTEAIRRVYHKKSEIVQPGPQSRKNVSPTAKAKLQREEFEVQAVQQKVWWFG